MNSICAVLFDFGGVIAEEGFRGGLTAIAESRGLDPGPFFRTAEEVVYETGYVTGRVDEVVYWDAIRKKTGITGSDEALREEILKRFVLRDAMLSIVDGMRDNGIRVGILSDQTNWLEEVDGRTPFYHRFHCVLNSFRMGKSKRDPSLFADVVAWLQCKSGEVLFIDDNEKNTERAKSQGLVVIHFTTVQQFLTDVGGMLPSLAVSGQT